MLGRAKFKRGLVFLAALTMLLSVFRLPELVLRPSYSRSKSGVDSYVPRRYI